MFLVMDITLPKSHNRHKDLLLAVSEYHRTREFPIEYLLLMKPQMETSHCPDSIP
jgi:hypothetical protein